MYSVLKANYPQLENPTIIKILKRYFYFLKCSYSILKVSFEAPKRNLGSVKLFPQKENQLNTKLLNEEISSKANTEKKQHITKELKKSIKICYYQ